MRATALERHETNAEGCFCQGPVTSHDGQRKGPFLEETCPSFWGGKRAGNVLSSYPACRLPAGSRLLPTEGGAGPGRDLASSARALLMCLSFPCSRKRLGRGLLNGTGHVKPTEPKSVRPSGAALPPCTAWLVFPTRGTLIRWADGMGSFKKGPNCSIDSLTSTEDAFA